MTTDTRNLPGLLEKADGARHAVTTANGNGAKAAPDQSLSSFIRLSLDDPSAALLLQNAASHIAWGWPTDTTAKTILDEVMALTGAELGNVQIADPVTQELHIAANAGFKKEFLEYFAVVDDSSSACGRAALQHAQTVIADVDTDDGFAKHRGIAAASKFRAVQSTPLIDAAGNLIGMVSTHFPDPGAPAVRALELTRLYGLVAGEALARSLPPRTEPHPAEHDDGVPASPEASTTLPRTTVLELTDTVVRSLLSAGLSLASVQSLIGDGVASEQVAAAIEELEHALGGIRSAVLDLHA
jgi:GAF domain-containing protein